MAEEEKTVEELQAELDAANVKVKEFRENNISLKTSLEAFEGVDVEEYRKMKGEADALEKQELLKSGDVEAILAKERAESDKRIEALNTRIAELDGTIVKMTVTDRLKIAASKVGARTEAIDDLVSSVGSDWELRDGVPVHVRLGEIVLSEKNAGQNMEMEEYFSAVATSKPFYFGESTGGGGEQSFERGDGVRVIENTAENLGKYSKEIREGKVKVATLQSEAA